MFFCFFEHEKNNQNDWPDAVLFKRYFLDLCALILILDGTAEKWRGNGGERGGMTRSKGQGVESNQGCCIVVQVHLKIDNKMRKHQLILLTHAPPSLVQLNSCLSMKIATWCRLGKKATCAAPNHLDQHFDQLYTRTKIQPKAFWYLITTFSKRSRSRRLHTETCITYLRCFLPSAGHYGNST